MSTTLTAKKKPGSAKRPKRSATAVARTKRGDAAVQNQAARFTRVREDHSREIAEDYVELIAELIAAHGEARTVDIARRLGVSHVTVTKTITRLQKEGLVSTQPYRSIFLTTEGEEIAQRSAARHTLVVTFLRKLGVSRADAESDAEGIEHHLSAATLAAMERFVLES